MSTAYFIYSLCGLLHVKLQIFWTSLTGWYTVQCYCKIVKTWQSLLLFTVCSIIQRIKAHFSNNIIFNKKHQHTILRRAHSNSIHNTLRIESWRDVTTLSTTSMTKYTISSNLVPRSVCGRSRRRGSCLRLCPQENWERYQVMSPGSLAKQLILGKKTIPTNIWLY